MISGIWESICGLYQPQHALGSWPRGLGLAYVAKGHLDPTEAERRDQRVGTLTVVLAYGAVGAVIVGGLVALVVLVR